MNARLVGTHGYRLTGDTGHPAGHGEICEHGGGYSAYPDGVWQAPPPPVFPTPAAVLAWLAGHTTAPGGTL